MSVRILLALAAAAPVAAQGRVITVDAQNRPGTDYTTIAAAVAASVDGDRLRVRDGTYDVFRVDSKAISIVGEPGAVVRYDLNVGVEIRGLPPAASARSPASISAIGPVSRRRSPSTRAPVACCSSGCGAAP